MKTKNIDNKIKKTHKFLEKYRPTDKMHIELVRGTIIITTGKSKQIDEKNIEERTTTLFNVIIYATS